MNFVSFWRVKIKINIDDEEDSKVRAVQVDQKIHFKKRKRESLSFEKTKRKKKIPTEFIQHILSLGFSEKDADRLYQEKDNWSAVSTGGRILCAKTGCKFYTSIASDELFEHCRSKHLWGDYPCPEENCSFVAYSETALKKHVVFHSQPPTSHRDYPCSMANCKASFPGKYGLQRHLNVHNNIQLNCIFCPFTTGEPDKLLIHQRSHFNIRDYQLGFWRFFLMWANLSD